MVFVAEEQRGLRGEERVGLASAANTASSSVRAALSALREMEERGRASSRSRSWRSRRECAR